MGPLEDILRLLERFPKWEAMTEAPNKIDVLERRIVKLERSLSRAPGEACPSCGAFDFRVASSKPHRQLGDLGAVVRTMECGECGFTEDKVITP